MTRDQWIKAAEETFRAEGNLCAEDAVAAAKAAFDLSNLAVDPVEAARMLMAED
jgi:hypothetical protein